MGSLNMALEALAGSAAVDDKTGPRGGNLADPRQHPAWRNAPLAAKVVDGNVIGLHDSRKGDTAMCGMQKEQPWHRMAAHMLNRGFSNEDVADAANVEKQTISSLRANRWFNELCATLAEDKDRAIRARIDGYALDAVEAIAAVAFGPDQDPENPTPMRVRLTAQTTLLEQSIGRPTQKVLSVSATTSFNSEREEYDAIMQELRTIRPAITAVETSGAEGHDENGHSAFSVDGHDTAPTQT